MAQRDREEYEDIIEELEARLIDRYFCNFSVFQSLPDSWAIDQIFPIMPVHRLDEEPERRGTIQDVTCDSDGKIDRFVGGKHGSPSLPLHPYRHGEPYILGIFLTGAYQEILGDLHNLFGDTNAVHVRLSESGYEVTDLVHGDTVTEVLNYVQFRASDLLTTFRRKVSCGDEHHASGGEHVHRGLRRRARGLHLSRGRQQSAMNVRRQRERRRSASRPRAQLTTFHHAAR